MFYSVFVFRSEILMYYCGNLYYYKCAKTKKLGKIVFDLIPDGSAIAWWLGNKTSNSMDVGSVIRNAMLLLLSLTV